MPRAVHLTVSLYLCSSSSNAQGQSRALEGHLVSSKSLSRVRDVDEVVAGGTEEKSPGVIFFPLGKEMILYKKEI